MASSIYHWSCMSSWEKNKVLNFTEIAVPSNPQSHDAVNLSPKIPWHERRSSRLAGWASDHIATHTNFSNVGNQYRSLKLGYQLGHLAACLGRNLLGLVEGWLPISIFFGEPKSKIQVNRVTTITSLRSWGPTLLSVVAYQFHRLQSYLFRYRYLMMVHSLWLMNHSRKR